VAWNMNGLWFSSQLGIPSSQLTKSIIFHRGIPPTSNEWMLDRKQYGKPCPAWGISQVFLGWNHDDSYGSRTWYRNCMGYSTHCFTT
jgi:hypothetical protein